MKTILILGVLLASASFAHAEEHHDGPCKKIKAACEAAGFTKGAHKKTGKGLFVDCMKKIMDGQSVEGVSASADDVNACKVRKAKRAERKKKSA